MTSPFPFVANTVLSAAQLNSIAEAWTSYTPVFKTGATTRTATVTYAKFCVVNKLSNIQVELTCTEAGTANAILSISLPTTLSYPRNTSAIGSVGTFTIQDTGTAFYVGSAVLGTNIIQGTASGAVDNMGASTPAMTIANGDKVSFSVVLEIN